MAPSGVSLAAASLAHPAIPLPFFTEIWTPESDALLDEELELSPSELPEPPPPADDIVAPEASSTWVSSVGESPCLTRSIIFCQASSSRISHQRSFSYTEVVGTAAV